MTLCYSLIIPSVNFEYQLIHPELTDISQRSANLDQLFISLEQSVGYYVTVYATPVLQQVLAVMKKTLQDLKPVLLVAYPIVGQIIILALGLALVPVLGPFGPLVTELIGQVIMAVIKIFIDSIQNANNFCNCLVYPSQWSATQI